MEGEGVSISHDEMVAKEIVDSSNSLEDQLGKDWKQRSIFGSVNGVFTPEEIEMIAKRKEPTLDTTNPTDAEMWALTANAVFQGKSSTYRATVVEDDTGGQEVYLEGAIGRDRFYALAPYFSIQNQKDGRTLVAFGVRKVGFITQEGEVFSIDGLMKEEGKQTDLVYLTSSGRKPNANMELSRDSSDDVICTLPDDPEGVGVMAHELGHAIRARKRRDVPEQTEVSNKAHVRFKAIAKGEEFVSNNNEEKLSDQSVRKLVANEERGAWATGISLIREVGKEIDLGVSSTENIGKMITRSEHALGTYDEVPYNVTSQTSKKEPVPTFSREMKSAARELRRKAKEHQVNYSQLSNFDELTGQPIGNNPRRLINEVERKVNKPVTS